MVGAKESWDYEWWRGVIIGLEISKWVGQTNLFTFCEVLYLTIMLNMIWLQKLHCFNPTNDVFRQYVLGYYAF